MKCKRSTYIRSLKIASILIPVILFVLFLPINHQEDTRRIREYYMEEPYSLDVVFMGASDVYAGYSPVLAYEEYGFTSYSYVLSGNYIQLIPRQLDEVHRTQDPKLIVIEITELLKTYEVDQPRLYQFLAGIPFSQNKLDIVRDYAQREHLLSYFVPFIVNHGSMEFSTLLNNVRSADYIQDRGYSLLKGSLTFTGSGENWDGEYVTPIDTNNDFSKAEIPQDVKDNFLNLIAYCKENHYDNILFVNFPHRITEDALYQRYQITNSLEELIESQGYDFINLERMLEDIGIQPETDFYNNAHMNLYGQYKITRYLGNILQSEYGIGESQLSPENKERWDTCVDYQHLFYQFFDYEFKTRDPEEFGLWLKEDAWTFEMIEDIKNNGLPLS